jgi:hypothetical protein
LVLRVGGVVNGCFWRSYTSGINTSFAASRRTDVRQAIRELNEIGVDAAREAADRYGPGWAWRELADKAPRPAPDLLRAFIPFAHAQSGIREELTSRTLAAIDALRTSYKREVLREADYWWLDDAV